MGKPAAAVVALLALLLAGCSTSEPPEPSPEPSVTTEAASSDDVTRAMWQCVTFRWGHRIVDSEDAARESCERARDHDAAAFVDEWLTMYDERWPDTDPAFDLATE